MMAEGQKETHWVIERASECLREWWAGANWSGYYTQSQWYADEPDAPEETGDEGARAVHYETREMESG